jgi:2-polyprenyl-3-methyl-5-hydroxy-6-metoxy-1,4-benzoquinol methylase
MGTEICKICGSFKLTIIAHTARCGECGVLLFYPYPKDDVTLVEDGVGKQWPRERVMNWYSRSSFYNHSNFTHMLLFAMDESFKGKRLNILDYGGGGGQFALICKSHFPESTIYITDISDESLLEEWKPLNTQISFKDFSQDQTKFDFIFLNDVFEHVSDPVFVLKQLSSKLKDDGRMFVDTPKQFWIYPMTKLVSNSLFLKVLKGTVTTSHLQIWSKRSFEFVVKSSNLRICRYKETSEFTMPADYYMGNMGITNPLLKLFGRVFCGYAKRLVTNKIVCVLLPISAK